jgi:hypothetical protein
LAKTKEERFFPTSKGSKKSGKKGKEEKGWLSTVGDGHSTVDKSRGKIELRAQKQKYTITAPTGKVAGLEDVVLKVGYNVQPWVGPLAWDWNVLGGIGWKKIKGGVSKVFRMPEVKVKKPVTASA